MSNSALERAPAAAAHAPAEDHKILGIELLRFLSSVAVLVFHYQHFAFRGANQVDFIASRQPFYPLLSFFYRYGFYGVEVFWCISGFIFFWKYGRQIAQARLGGYVFFILRLSRLYPLHFVTLLFMAAMQAVYLKQNGTYYVYQYNDSYHFVLQLFMASNWGLQNGDSFNGPIWSISIEVLVYAVFFVLLRYVSGSTIFVACVTLAAALVQFLNLSTHPVFVCLMFFFLGCLTAIGYRHLGTRANLRRVASVGALLLVLGVPVAGFLLDLKPKYFLILFTPALILLCVTHFPAARGATRILVPAGNMTYASYLLHVPIQIAVMTSCTYAGIHVPFYNAAFFLAFIAATLLLSHLTYEYFEMPAQKLLRKVLIPKGTAAVVTPARTQDA